MNFKNKYDYRRNAPGLNAGFMIGAIVSDAGGSGELETLRSQVERLTEIVGFMAAHLPPAALLALADRYGWEEVK
jgi:hypothetical protein